MGRIKLNILMAVLLLSALPFLALAEGDLFSEKKELLDLIAEDNAASDINLDSSWGAHNPFDSAAIATLPSPVSAPVKKVPGPQGASFSLGGILWTGDRPSAIINNQVVGVDTVIYGMTVTQIKENLVILSDGKSETVLSLHQ